MTFPGQLAGAPGMPPAPHPTVPYGQPGGPGTVVLPPNAPIPSASSAAQMAAAAPPAPPAAPGFYPPPAPAAAPAPAAPAPPGTFPAGSQPPYMSAPAPQAPPAQGQEQVRIPDNFVLDGPNVPPELRGRTWGQVRGVYGALAQEFISQRPGAVPAPRPNQPAAPAPAAAQPPRAPAPQAPQSEGQDRIRSFWEDPMAAIERAIDTRLAPVTERTAAMAVQDAKNAAMAAIPDYAVLEAEMIPTLRAAGPQLLADPSFWMSTADLARGRLMGRGQYPMNGQRPTAPQAPPQYSSAPPGPGAAVPTHSFFTEAPTPPAVNGFNGSGNPNQWELTAEQKMYAQKMQMTEQEYRDWSGGVQRPTQARRAW